MNTLISLLLAVLFTALCSDSLRKRPIPWYLGATVIAAAVVLVQLTRFSTAFPSFVSTWIWPLFFRGGLAGALFLIVMWTGALPNGSKLFRRLLPVRGELSILASILTLGHNAANGLTYFKYLFTDPSRLPFPTLLAAVCSLVMICIMLPLFITSFRRVRKKMKATAWKRLQRLAYGFYFLLYVHLCLLYVPMLLAGRNYWLTFVLYTFCFTGYAGCRVCKYLATRQRQKEGLGKRQVRWLADAALLTACAALALRLAVPAEAAAPARRSSGTGSDTQVATTAQPLETAPGAERADAAEPTDAAFQETEPEGKTPTGAVEATEPTVPPLEETALEEAEATEPEPPEAADAAEDTAKPPTEGGQLYLDGTYTGTGEGYEGPITVSITVEGDAITSIRVVDQDEDPEFFTPALSVIDAVLAAQHTDVDAVSGSTYSSWGILDAVDAALAAARIA